MLRQRGQQAQLGPCPHEGGMDGLEERRRVHWHQGVGGRALLWGWEKVQSEGLLVPGGRKLGSQLLHQRGGGRKWGGGGRDAHGETEWWQQDAGATSAHLASGCMCRPHPIPCTRFLLLSTRWRCGAGSQSWQPERVAEQAAPGQSQNSVAPPPPPPPQPRASTPPYSVRPTWVVKAQAARWRR